jgi:glutaredoxin
LQGRFAGLNTQVLGISIDHTDCLRAWANSLGGIEYPLLADFWPHGVVCELYGVFRPDKGFSQRVIFIIDKDGVIRYIDVHPVGQPDNDVLLAELAKISPELAKQHKEPEAVALPHGGVVMYCTAWCPDCKKARVWLKQHQIPYTEVDITTTPGASVQLKKWANNTLTTPTFDIDGTIIVDFKEDELKKILKV